MVRRVSTGHNSGALWLRRSYNVIDRDPECDHFRTLFRREHLKEDDFAALAGLANTTVKNMFGGKTQQPRHSTFAKMAGALGYTYELTRDKTPNYEKEIPKAREERKLYRLTLAKRKARKSNGHKRAKG